MSRAIILLGGNLGDVRETFRQAKALLSAKGHSISAASSLYSTPPWGFESEHPFLNQALIVNTDAKPARFLAEVLETERQLGRERSAGAEGYSSRPVDIDILFWNDEVIREKDLEIPHPRMHLRKFALVPLVELLPDMVHPVFKITVSELLRSCPDTSPVTKLEA